MIRGTLIEVTKDESTGEYTQVPNTTGRVLFHIAAPVEQGEIDGRTEDNLEGLPKNAVLPSEYDQYRILKELRSVTSVDAEAQEKLHKLYAIGKSDDMHALVEVTIGDLQAITEPTKLWSEFLWYGTEGTTDARETERLKEQEERMSSLLRQIFEKLYTFNYYLLVGKEIYKMNLDRAEYDPAMFIGLHERLRTSNKITEMPIYNVDVHPLRFSMVQSYIRTSTVSYALLADTRVHDEEHVPGLVPEYTLARDIRYVNWSLGDSDLLAGLTKFQGTYVKEKGLAIQEYHANPELFIDKHKDAHERKAQ